MASRTVDQQNYRFGFNGKENDGETGTQDYGMRIYNPTLGKFLSVDPLSSKYPYYTPYQFAGNMPIWAIDVDGLEPVTPDAVEKDQAQARNRRINYDYRNNELSWKEMDKNGILTGNTVRINFDPNGMGESELKRMDNDPMRVFRNSNWVWLIVNSEAIKRSKDIAQVIGPTLVKDFQNQLIDAMNSPRSEEDEKLLDGATNMFRHLLGQGMVSRLYGTDVAEFMGNAHEISADPKGGAWSFGMQGYDSAADLINNYYGRKYNSFFGFLPKVENVTSDQIRTYAVGVYLYMKDYIKLPVKFDYNPTDQSVSDVCKTLKN